MNNISIYVHTPFCKHKCYYCDFASYANSESYIKDYYEALKKEIILKKEQIKSRNISTLYFGGGTPSYVDSKYIGEIINSIKSNFNFENNAEITIELNPESVTKEKLQDYKKFGFNRLSMGLQSANNETLKRIGRIHTVEKFKEAFLLSREEGFKNINVDLMFSLPKEKLINFIDSLEFVLTLNPEHISSYSLILEKGTKLYDYYKNNNIEQNDVLDRQMYHYLIQKLNEYGYNQYEISNFAKEGYESRHNLRCWDFYDYIGFGSNASSFIDNKRITNKENIKEYIEDIEKNILPIKEEHLLTKDELIGDYIMLALRKTKGLNIDNFNKKFNLDFENIYKEKINKFKEMGLVQIKNNHFCLTYKGLDFANIVMMEFI